MSRDNIHSEFVRLFALDVVPGAPLREFEEVELRLEVTFPQSLIDFLFRFGPVYTPTILDLVTGGESEIAPEGASFDVQNFMGPREIEDNTRAYWSGGMDDWLVIFATDCMGNAFGFRRQQLTPRPDDAVVYVFDHDFGEIKEEAKSFDDWLQSFIHMQRDVTRQSTPEL
ncbi:MAG: SMI1/KNR4 family protein [Verrucomicrobiota bacterium]